MTQSMKSFNGRPESDTYVKSGNLLYWVPIQQNRTAVPWYTSFHRSIRKLPRRWIPYASHSRALYSSHPYWSKYSSCLHLARKRISITTQRCDRRSSVELREPYPDQPLEKLGGIVPGKKNHLCKASVLVTRLGKLAYPREQLWFQTWRQCVKYFCF